MFGERNKRNEEEKILKGKKGITLIALVITIIVLLILAGVSIAMLTGENGILTQVQDAKNENDQSTLEEEVGLAVSSYRIDKQTGETGDLEGELNKIGGATVEKIEEGTYYVERNGYGVTVSEDGEIEEGKLDIWDGTTTEKPEVDAEGNWHIYTAAQMKFFAQYCNGEIKAEEMPAIIDSTTVYLEKNIDMGARQENGELTSGVEWTPVGMSKGMFDGKEHSVSGIYVKDPDGRIAGLFSQGNIIQNLSIKNSYIENDGIYAAGIAGSIISTITNCQNINTVVKTTYNGNSLTFTGGIVGMSYSPINITDCTNSGNIISTSIVGGIVGGVGVILSGSVIENCTNYGNLNGTEMVGGIVGITNTVATISNSYNSGEISGTSRVGGIVGVNADEGVISNCYNKGMVSGNTEVGAIIGKQNGSVGTNLSNLYYLNTLQEIKAINGVDYEKQNIKGISEDFNSYEEFMEWLNQQGVQ